MLEEEKSENTNKNEDTPFEEAKKNKKKHKEDQKGDVGLEEGKKRENEKSGKKRKASSEQESKIVKKQKVTEKEKKITHDNVNDLENSDKKTPEKEVTKQKEQISPPQNITKTDTKNDISQTLLDEKTTEELEQKMTTPVKSNSIMGHHAESLTLQFEDDGSPKTKQEEEIDGVSFSSDSDE